MTSAQKKHRENQMGTLYFDPEKVREAINQARAAKPEERRATFGQYLDGGAYTDDLKEVPGGIAKVNASLKPEVHLVHDEGIYLMANAWLEDAKMVIVYAVGCDPNKEDRETVWHRCRELVGGDDFADSIPLAPIERLITDPLTDELMISVTPNRLAFAATRFLIKQGNLSKFDVN